ncbi:hypothetical protein ILUMI_03825 [Ignelater luminosus]|uniref:Uncharacterized protein n=1 Tax=Ignelater luminosus TaxID=2038154 RepID=A0A8K0DDY7_IGNLU|nr:hypothetical protein ILUMI_03825 [Ignelater luminosus]
MIWGRPTSCSGWRRAIRDRDRDRLQLRYIITILIIYYYVKNFLSLSRIEIILIYNYNRSDIVIRSSMGLMKGYNVWNIYELLSRVTLVSRAASSDGEQEGKVEEVQSPAVSTSLSLFVFAFSQFSLLKFPVDLPFSVASYLSLSQTQYHVGEVGGTSLEAFGTGRRCTDGIHSEAVVGTDRVRRHRRDETFMTGTRRIMTMCAPTVDAYRWKGEDSY